LSAQSFFAVNGTKKVLGSSELSGQSTMIATGTEILASIGAFGILIS